MKTITRLSALLTALCLLALTLCACGGDVTGLTIDYGQSECYTKQEMDDAISVIKATFSEFEGCELHLLEYAGDGECAANLSYCDSLNPEAGFAQCMVFKSSFHSPKEGGGAWNADMEYTWSWYLARTTGGSWVLLTYGY